MNKAPLAVVKEKFGDKAALVAALQAVATEDLWLGRTNEEKGLKHVSNAKLLRLHQTFSEVKAKFGTRAALIDAVAAAEKRSKDEGFKVRLGKYPVPRLFDMYKAATKRAKAAAKTAKS